MKALTKLALAALVAASAFVIRGLNWRRRPYPQTSGCCPKQRSTGSAATWTSASTGNSVSETEYGKTGQPLRAKS